MIIQNNPNIADMNPKVSIIVPIYNVEKYLDRCMDSLLNQTLKDIEIIMVDDGSPDNCPQMCDEYAKKDSRVKVVHKENAGLGYARNSGLDVATGEYVAFVDSDDYVALDMYENLYSAIKKWDTQMVLCGFNEVLYNKSEKGVITNMPIHPKVVDAKKEYLTNIIGQLPEKDKELYYTYCVWNVLYSNEVIQKNHIRFKSERIYVSEDILFQVEYASRSSNILLLPTPYYNYCHNSNSLTRKYDKNRFEKTIALYDEICNRLKYLNVNIDNFELRKQRFLLAKTLYTVCDAIKYLSSKDASKEIKRIGSNHILQKLLEKYPINRMPLKKRLFYYLLRNGLSIPIIYLYKFSH